MPQPITNVPNLGSIYIGNAGDRPFSHAPQLGCLFAEAIASSSNVDSFMLNLFVELLGGPADKAATAYMALDTRGPRTAAVNAVAKQVLSQDHLELYDALMKLVKATQKKRDTLAHGVWGYGTKRKDLLLCMDPRHKVSPPTIDMPIPYDKIFAYFEQDFLEIINSNDRLCGFGLEFLFVLRGHPANGNNQLYDSLCREPEVQETLNRTGRKP